MKSRKMLSLLGLGLALSACTGEEPAVGGETAGATPAAAPAVAAAATAPAAQPTGNVIEVKMVMKGSENYFEPAEITARPGDVVRFVLDSGVHNVSFPADKNPGLSGLPAASPYLTQAGQTYDMTVDLAPGSYTFQCDPHVAMGMFGKLNVQ